MLTWRGILDKSWDSDLLGSRLAKAVHISLLFAMVEPCWAITLHFKSIHLVVVGMVFTMHLAHEHFFVVIHNQSDP
jgi:hypothetical protein